MQIYQSKIVSHEHLQYVASVVSGFNQDRYLAALMGKKNLTNAQLVDMRINLSEISDRLEREYNNLQQFGASFNEIFTTDNNECFSSAMTLLKKVRSGLNKMVQIYKQFAPNDPDTLRLASHSDTKLDLYSRSSMADSEYARPLFDASNFSPEVQALFNTMSRFMGLMDKCFQLCQDILAEEQQIRNNPDSCHKLYIEFKDAHRRLIKDMINSINIYSCDFSEENNEAILLRNHSENEKQFSQKGFHNLTVSATAALASKEIVEEAQRGEYSEDELFLFDGNNRSKIHRIRYIITHFDEFLPESFNRKIIPAVYVACFMWWCKPKEDLGFVKYFSAIYTQANGQHKPPSNPAVNQAKRTDWNSIPEYNNLINRWENVEIG